MRRIIEDYEAKLRPPSGEGDGSGKAEWELDGNEDVQISVRFRELDVPDGSLLDVRVAGGTIGSVPARRGGGRLEIESKDGLTMPMAVNGQVVEVRHAGRIVLSGTFEPD